MFYGELKVHGDLVRFEVLNNPADINVTVEKRGNDEVMAGDEMRYDFSEISNTSNIPLSDFCWHDKLPTEAVRLKTIFTGTWNESLIYSVVYKTNLKSSYKTLAANLSSKTSHTLDCSLLLSERLFPHLRDVDEIANERSQRGVYEEVILDELVYE